MRINWNNEKNTLLKNSRDISFEDVEVAIMNDNIIDIIPHFNPAKYPNQEIMIVEIRGYVHYVPFVMDDSQIFLKNIIPSRKYHKIYKGAKNV